MNGGKEKSCARHQSQSGCPNMSCARVLMVWETCQEQHRPTQTFSLLSPSLTGGLRASQSNSFITSWREKPIETWDRDLLNLLPLCAGGVYCAVRPPNSTPFALAMGKGAHRLTGHLTCSVFCSRFPLLLLSLFFFYKIEDKFCPGIHLGEKQKLFAVQKNLYYIHSSTNLSTVYILFSCATIFRFTQAVFGVGKAWAAVIWMPLYKMLVCSDLPMWFK